MGIYILAIDSKPSAFKLHTHIPPIHIMIVQPASKKIFYEEILSNHCGGRSKVGGEEM